MSWTHFLIFIAELPYYFLIYAIIYLKHGIIKQHNSFWAAGNILCLRLVGRYMNVLFDKSWRYINTCIIYFFIYQLILLKSLLKTHFDILCLNIIDSCELQYLLMTCSSILVFSFYLYGFVFSVLPLLHLQTIFSWYESP